MTGSIQGSTNADVTPRSPGARVLTGVAGAVCLLVVLVVLVRIFVRPIPPEQTTPEGHFGEPCALCHIVSENAEPVELP